MKHVTAALLLCAGVAHAQQYVPPPHVRFINVHTSFSALPAVYIDEWGNARIDAFCPDYLYVDLKLGPERFNEAAQILHNLDFFTLPYSLNSVYSGPKDKRKWGTSYCDHCARYVVTFNERDFWNLHTVEFVDNDDSRVAAIRKLIGVVTRGQEAKLCKE